MSCLITHCGWWAWTSHVVACPQDKERRKKLRRRYKMTYLNQFCGSSQAFRLYMYMWPSWIEIKYNSIVYSSLAFKMIASVLRAGFVFVWEGRGSYNFCGKGGACTTSVGRAGLIQLCGNGRACTTSVGRAGLVHTSMIHQISETDLSHATVTVYPPNAQSQGKES